MPFAAHGNNHHFVERCVRTDADDDTISVVMVQAFALRSVAAAARQTRRRLDQEEKKQHVPLLDRTPDEPPPVLVAVVGPPGVGKSTVIRSLVHHYTRQNLTHIHGPITVVSGTGMN